MNWYDAHYLCKNCIGCDAVADGEAGCLCEEEWIEEGDNY